MATTNTNLALKKGETLKTLDEIIPREVPKPAPIEYNPNYCKQYNADTDNMNRNQLVKYIRVLEKTVNTNNKIWAKSQDIRIVSSKLRIRKGVGKLSEKININIDKDYKHLYDQSYSILSPDIFDSINDYYRTALRLGNFYIIVMSELDMLDKIGEGYNEYRLIEKLQKITDAKKIHIMLNEINCELSQRNIMERADEVAKRDAKAKFSSMAIPNKAQEIRQIAQEVHSPSYDFDAGDFALVDEALEWAQNLNEGN